MARMVKTPEILWITARAGPALLELPEPVTGLLAQRQCNSPTARNRLIS